MTTSVVTGMVPLACSVCGLYAAGCRRPWLAGVGPAGADVMVVGDYPGIVEDTHGIPWSGPSGQTLRQRLVAHGIDPNRVYFTNAIRCRPLRFDAVTDRQLTACHAFLLTELRAVRPKVVLALGEHAARSVVGKGDFRDARAEVWDWEGVPVVCSYNPAAALRGDMTYAMGLDEDLVQVARAVRGELVRPQEYDHRLVTTVEGVREMLADLRRSPHPTAFDLETSPRRPYDRVSPPVAILCMSFCAEPGRAYVVSWDHAEAPQWARVSRMAVWAEIKAFMEDPTVSKVGQNAKFDIEWFLHFGVVVRGLVGCTMLAQLLIDDTARRGLAALAWKYTDMGPYWRELDTIVEDLGAPVDYARIPWAVLWPYSAKDPDATLRVWLAQRAKLEELGSLWVHQNVHAPASLSFARAQAAGVHIDMRRQATMEQSIDVLERELVARIRALPTVRRYEAHLAEAGKPVDKETGFRFRPTSPDQVADFLYRFLGHSAVAMRRTRGKDRDAADHEALVALADSVPAAKHILALRKVVKYGSTYIRPLGLQRKPDGLVHADFRLDGTRTGRISCADPNLLNQPREDNQEAQELGLESPKLLWTSRFDGGMVGECDLSQIEVRVMASFSGDPDLITLFRRGGDVHRAVAAEVWNLRPEDVPGHVRHAAKRIVFALAYGGEADKIAKLAECTREEAEEFIAKYFRRFPAMKVWMEGQKRFAAANGYVQTATGQRRRLLSALGRYYDASSDARVAEALRQAINTPVQGTASHIALCGFNTASEVFADYRLRSQVISHVYDSIEVDIHPAEIELVSRLLPMIMSGLKFSWLHVPIEAEMKLGRSWGEAKAVHFDQAAKAA